nr:Mitochondrial inner membrane translocase complex subunit Tim21 [Hymenolepis microstoma]
MLRRTGGERGSSKKVSIVENQMDVDLRRIQEDILTQIRNRSAFPLRRVKRNDQRQDSTLDVYPRQRHTSGPTSNNHHFLTRTNSIFNESYSPSDSNSFPLPSPPLPSPPPPDTLPVVEPANPMMGSEEITHSNANFKNFVRFHKSIIDKNGQESGTRSQSTYKSSTNHRNHIPARGLTSRPQSLIKIHCDNDENSDSLHRPPSPPLRYSPNEDNFKPTFARPSSMMVTKNEPAQDSSPSGSDVDVAIRKAENRKKQLEIKPSTAQNSRRLSGTTGKSINIQDTPSPLIYSRPKLSQKQQPIVKYCISSNVELEDFKEKEEEEKGKKELLHIPLIRDPPKIFVTRGVTPFRRMSRLSTSSSSASSSPVIGCLEATSSIDEDNHTSQRGKWVFPTRRSIYAEESQQAQYELRSSLSRKEIAGKSEEEKKPPHHYTGPWMFKGLSPRLPPPLERSRERRSICSTSSRSLFCPLTVQSENNRSTTKVDRMVSPIPSPPLPTQSSTSIYGTLSRYPRSRHQSGVFLPKQGDLDISIGNGVPNSGYATWRAPRGHLSLTAEYNGEADDRRTSANLGASRISLWNQKITTVEHPEPHRFGSLGRNKDRLIRKYLQRHSSIQGSKVFLPETIGSNAYSHCNNL